MNRMHGARALPRPLLADGPCERRLVSTTANVHSIIPISVPSGADDAAADRSTAAVADEELRPHLTRVPGFRLLRHAMGPTSALPFPPCRRISVKPFAGGLSQARPRHFPFSASHCKGRIPEPGAYWSVAGIGIKLAAPSGKKRLSASCDPRARRSPRSRSVC